MKSYLTAGVLAILLATACQTTATSPGGTSAPKTSLTDTGLAQGTNIPVWTTDDLDDEGLAVPGSLRQALEQAQPYDTISFDTQVFDPEQPATITVATELPFLDRDNLTLDASGAGVILNGSQMPGDWVAGLQIVNASGVTIQGLQISGFPGPGIAISGDSRDNLIGGSRGLGDGPYGQGNMLAHNAIGIDLSTSVTARNTLAGNLIGTDGIHVSGEHGNLRSGITITEGAHDNLIGADNLIAYNGEYGVYIQGAGASGNRLTGNSIHHNGAAGIYLVEEANAGLRPPYIYSIDLAGGLLSGSGCAGCSIEIYSTRDGEEGEFYEGRAVADSQGYYSFDLGQAFRYEDVTATATDAQGNTSAFSRPAGVFAAYDVLTQADNPFPPTLLLSRPSRDIEYPDTRLGMGLYSSNIGNDIPHLDTILQDFTDLGVKRVDTSLNENEPPINWDYPENEIPPEFDQFVDGLNANGITVSYLLHFWDKEGHPEGDGLETPRFKTKEQIEAFLDYVRFIVGHFRGRIQYYTIWTEPDYCGDGGLKCIETQDYINLARETIPVIREEDPRAKVVLAPYVLYYARREVFTILESPVIRDFDGIQWHGIYDVFPGSAHYGNYYYEYPALLADIQRTAAANGFKGEYWGTELSWCTQEVPDCKPPDQPQEILATDKLAAKYAARVVVTQLGMDIGVSFGGLNSDLAPWTTPAVRNLYTIMAGTAPSGLDVRIKSQATNIVSYAFTTPEGDRMLALWTDGVALENDPGVKADLTIHGLEAENVVALDVHYGFEQELVTQDDNGDLVIPGLLVKDYPLILRFSE